MNVKSDQLSLPNPTICGGQLYYKALLLNSIIPKGIIYKTYKNLSVLYLRTVRALAISPKLFLRSVEDYINYCKLSIGTALEVGYLNKLLHALYKKPFTAPTRRAKKIIYLPSRYLKTIAITWFLLLCTCVPLLLMKKLDPYSPQSPDHFWQYANHLYALPLEDRVYPIHDVDRVCNILDYLLYKELQVASTRSSQYALASAREIYDDIARSSLRWPLEAYLLSGLPSSDISQLLDVPIKTIGSYKSTFFDLGPVIDRPQLLNSFLYANCTDLAEDIQAKQMVVQLGLDAYLFNFHQVPLAEPQQKSLHQSCKEAYQSQKSLALAGVTQLSKSQIEVELLLLKERQVAASEMRINHGGEVGQDWDDDSIPLDKLRALDLRNIQERAGEAVVKLQQSQELSPHMAAISMIRQNGGGL
ncbi:hypothetical protein LNTAR_14972 [Lentisphaera araneosa HTCC2155]|uniref:Uncharacterized protein n=1 Tax=Lentisphaera araneosa HTCC2155 TaxID=313628 RepID=A6DHP6_9BACT|nr:hypothetical protein [Lentisphaera araneosa]EDM29129.1 hypothetical protein LNTAR_14972 [Lentisphaera araneosa HTCC2155]